MSKRHTLGISKWLPSTEDKITFEITLRPSTPDISKHLCICVYVFYRPSSNHKRCQFSKIRLFGLSRPCKSDNLGQHGNSQLVKC